MAVLVVIVVSGGCGVPLESSPSRLSDDAFPEGLRPSASTVPDAPAEQEPIDVWYVGDDRLVSTRHRIDPPTTPQKALEELLSGPTEAEQNRSLRTAIPDAAAVVEVSVVRGVATVTLTQAFSEIPAGDQVLAVGQIVLTLTDQRGVGRVRFAVDDAEIAVPLPSGETSGDGVSRDEFIELSNPSA
jgi:spore germination protein GerM